MLGIMRTLRTGELAHVSPHPTTKQRHVKFTRDFVDSCHPLCLVPPTPTPRFKRDWVGFLFWSSVPPPSVLCQPPPPPSPPNASRRGFPLVFPAPSNASLRRAPRPASTPLACVPRQCPRPARRINALACAPHQHPRPVRRVNAPSLRAVSTPPRCVDAPGLRAASTPPPLPLHSLPLH